MTEQPKPNDRVERRKQVIRGWLAVLTNAGFLFVVIWLVVEGLPTAGTDRDILLLLLGALVTLATGVNAFYFGSSQGSQDKTEILAEME